MKIAYLGAGTWGFCLASLLAENQHRVVLWTPDPKKAELLQTTRKHPKLDHFTAHPGLEITSDLKEALKDVDVIVESVTSKGIRPVFEQVAKLYNIDVPIVITSKGIEQNTGLLLPDVVIEILGEEKRKYLVVLSGPSHAEEVIQHLPTSVVCGAYDPSLMQKIAELFATPYFRVYPNSDMRGVAFGGAMKNIIAIACGISDGLRFGDNTKAALMTRGLHEIRKLALTQGCKLETLNGLSGLGDLCVTCLSTLSRNYRFGRLIAEGLTPQAAQEKIGMVVEGIYTVVSALQLAKKTGVDLPIAEAIDAIVYKNLNPKDAVKNLLQRAIKEEHL